MMTRILTILYTVLTTAIIALSKVRFRCTAGRKLRWDRTVRWADPEHKDILFMTCCDCGLGHCFVIGHSGTPIRPPGYGYRGRLGAMAHAPPAPELGREAQMHLHYQWYHMEDEGERIFTADPEMPGATPVEVST